MSRGTPGRRSKDKSKESDNTPDDPPGSGDDSDVLVVDKGSLDYRQFRKDHPWFEPLAQGGILMKHVSGVDPVKLGVQVGWNDVGPMVASAFTGIPHVGHSSADSELHNVPEEVGEHVNELIKDTVGIDVPKAAKSIRHSFKHFGRHGHF